MACTPGPSRWKTVTWPLSDATYTRPAWLSKATMSGCTPTLAVPVTRQVVMSTVSRTEVTSQATNASRAVHSHAVVVGTPGQRHPAEDRAGRRVDDRELVAALRSHQHVTRDRVIGDVAHVAAQSHGPPGRSGRGVNVQRRDHQHPCTCARPGIVRATR